MQRRMLQRLERMGNEAVVANLKLSQHSALRTVDVPGEIRTVITAANDSATLILIIKRMQIFSERYGRYSSLADSGRVVFYILESGAVLSGRSSSTFRINPKMEAICSFETSANLYRTTNPRRCLHRQSESKIQQNRYFLI
jgi:hypothetical protein